MFYYRKVLGDIFEYVNGDLILLLVGARQAGKTSILKEIQKRLEDKNVCHFINFEDPEIRQMCDDHPDNVFRVTGSSSSKKQILFIDEIQYLKNPTNFLKYLYDEYKGTVKLIVSGSSSFYIDRKFKDSLIGRKKVLNIYTLNFFEYLIFQGREDLVDIIKKHETLPINHKNIIVNYFDEYITFGGYPEIALIETVAKKKERLVDYSIDFVKKDIYEAKIQDEVKFKYLLKILAGQVGNQVNFSELANTIGVTQPTIEKYVYIMQKSFHLDLIVPFYTNIRKEITKMPKVFFYDLGIRNAMINNFETIQLRIDKGQYLENIVFREFLYQTRLDNIKFWRTKSKNEIDFVIDDKSAYEIKFTEKLVKKAKNGNFKKIYPDMSLEYIVYDDLLSKFYLVTAH